MSSFSTDKTIYQTPLNTRKEKKQKTLVSFNLGHLELKYYRCWTTFDRVVINDGQKEEMI